MPDLTRRKRLRIAKPLVGIAILTWCLSSSVTFAQRSLTSGSTDMLLVPETHPTIQLAIDASKDGQTISVAPGTYTESLQVRDKRLRLLGRGGAVATTLEGNGLDALVTVSSGAWGSVTLEGFMLRLGSPAIVCRGGTLVVSDCVFAGNDVNGSGGAIDVQRVKLSAVDCAFLHNQAGGVGGGIFAEDSEASVTRCMFSNNRSGSHGGALALLDSEIRIVDSILFDNDAAAMGGALWVSAPSKSLGANVQKSTFDGNRAEFGGAIAAVEVSMACDGIVCRRNEAEYGGAVFATSVSSAEVTFVRGEYERNRALYAGGALYLGSVQGRLHGNRIWMNEVLGAEGGLHAGGGGGLCLFSSEPVSVTHNVFYGNRSVSPHSLGGEGILVREGYPQIESTIFWGHSRDDVVVASGHADVSYCLLGHEWPGEGNLVADPMFVEPDLGNFHVELGSPAIDGGHPAYAPADEDWDIDGEPRVAHCRVDMGVDESPAFRDCNANGVADACECDSGAVSDCNGNLVPDSCEVDCNGNGIPDECDIESGNCFDANLNGVPDECDADCNANGWPDDLDVGRDFSWNSDVFTPLGDGFFHSWTIDGAPRAGASVTLRLEARGDLSDVDEWIDLYLNGIWLASLFVTMEFADCFPFPTIETLEIPPGLYNAILGGEDAVLTAVANANVDANYCHRSSLRMELRYRSEGMLADCDQDGVPDECRVNADCNQNGILDSCDIAYTFATATPDLSPVLYPEPLEAAFTTLPEALGPVTLRFETVADLSTPDEWLDVLLNGVSLGVIFRTGAKDYPQEPDTTTLTIPADVFNAAISQSGKDRLTLTPSYWVDDPTPSWLRCAIEYRTRDVRKDQDWDGVPDECQPGKTRGATTRFR